MVGFSLAEVFGEPQDTAETRVLRLRIPFEQLVEAVLDLRFDDAREHLAEIGTEIDGLETYIKTHTPPEERQGPPSGSSECGF